MCVPRVGTPPEVARGLRLFGGASSEVRRCKCSVVVLARASFLPEIYLFIYLSVPRRGAAHGAPRGGGLLGEGRGGRVFTLKVIP